jgi:hypothetical protein
VYKVLLNCDGLVKSYRDNSANSNPNPNPNPMVSCLWLLLDNDEDILMIFVKKRDAVTRN